MKSGRSWLNKPALFLREGQNDNLRKILNKENK